MNKTLGMAYSKRLPSGLRNCLNFPDERRDWDSVHDGSRALARVGMWGKWDKWDTGSSYWRVYHAITNQNRSVFMDLCKTLPRDYWRDEGVTSALNRMILYGMHAWMVELHEKEPGVDYSIQRDLFGDAFCVRDPIVVELLFKWGMKLSRKSIATARCWVLCRSIHPRFESQNAKKEFIIEQNREIVELLRPLADNYMHLMDTDCLQVDMEPALNI